MILVSATQVLVGASNQEKALVGAFSVIVKTDCETNGSLHSTADNTGPAAGTAGQLVGRVLECWAPCRDSCIPGGFLSRGLAAGGRTRDT